MQIRRMHAHRFIEFVDVGTTREYAAGTGDNNRFDVSVGKCRIDACRDGLSRGESHAVDGWVGEGNDGYLAVGLIVGGHDGGQIAIRSSA